MTYDNWGRQLTYGNTPAGQVADNATTNYDVNGRVTSVVDNNGQTAYAYDGADAAGKAERRGKVTAVKVKTTGGTEYTSTGAYDDNGDLTLERLPGTLVRRTDTDVAGARTGLRVNGQGVNSDTGGLDPDQPWLSWTTTSNAKSQIFAEDTPSGTAAGAVADYTYSYDKAGRLIAVQDYSVDPDVNGSRACITRTYSFDTNGNRTGQNTYPAAADSSCTSTGGSSIIRAYDTADRLTTGANGAVAYLYDPLGRQTTIPAADAPRTVDGNITLTYYDTDSVRSITQNSATTTYSLDGASRRYTQTKTIEGNASSTLVRHYSSSGDNPTWSVDTASGTSTLTRYNELIDGTLGLTITSSGATTSAQLSIGSPRGDTAATITLSPSMTGPGATAATGIDSWTSYSEYGAPQQNVDTTVGATAGIGYGWLGKMQRSTLDAGLTLMGARLYNRTTGSFTSPDSVDGGNDTSFGYPNDPVNENDITGRALGRNQIKFCLTPGHGRVCGAAAGARGPAIKTMKKYYKSKNARKYSGNAFQHAYWMARIVIALMAMGSKDKAAIKQATAFGVVHEADDPNPVNAEGRKDLVNNNVGAEIGVTAFKQKWSTNHLVGFIRLMAKTSCSDSDYCLQIKW